MSARLVAIGDSLTQGFQSGSISRTQVSYPALIADALGDKDFVQHVPDFSGEGGLPLNLEALLRMLADRYGPQIGWLEAIPAALSVNSFMDRVEDYWERGAGTLPANTGPIHRNLAVWGFQLGDCHTLSEHVCGKAIPRATDDVLPWKQIPEFAMYRTARRTLNPAFDRRYSLLTQLDLAKQIAAGEQGIDNLIFWLGANNCLGTVSDLTLNWSTDADLNPDRYNHERNCNLWWPEHFKSLLEAAADGVDAIGARHVFVGTVPHVTIPPISRGISRVKGGGERDAGGYYQYYTHFWVWDDDFVKAPRNFPHLTRDQAKLIDDTIDQYNEAMRAAARKRGWHVVDIARMLDRLAFRRQDGKPTYRFPKGLIKALRAHPRTQDRVTPDGEVLFDTRYLRVNPKGVSPREEYRGGIFSLDGIHPTTIGYGLVAHEFLEKIKRVWRKDRRTLRAKPLDWGKIVAADALAVELPENLGYLRETLGFLSSQTAALHGVLNALG